MGKTGSGERGGSGSGGAGAGDLDEETETRKDGASGDLGGRDEGGGGGRVSSKEKMETREEFEVRSGE